MNNGNMANAAPELGSVARTRLCSLLVLLFCWAGTLTGLAWRSVLYPQNWTPPGPSTNFETNKLLQDFSYAGYQAGEAPIPTIIGPVYNVTNAAWGADSTGTTDSTKVIQNAINAAKSAGGGVVYLPPGTFKISVQSGNAYALRIDSSGIVLRGAGAGLTFLLNTTTNMRDKVAVLIDGPSNAGFFTSGTGTTLLRSDVLEPSRTLHLASVSGLSVGQNVMVRATATDAWVLEHNEPGWVGYSNTLRGVAYFRQITAVDAINRTVTLNAPTRYYLKVRDAARIIKVGAPLSGSGMEHFSIGNTQLLGTGWAEEDYNYSTNASYYAHNSFLIKLQRTRDCWVRGVESFLPAGNSATCHLLSNGVLLSECSRVTVVDCHFQRPQFGGGGGNGYMYRLQNANNCLVQRCRATYSRHGLVLSHMGSSGNVFHECVDKESGHQTGVAGAGNTSGRNSDHHMHFSHSNLIDASTGESSSWEARYRPYGSPPYHNVTSAHGVYWNMLGTGGGSAAVVVTEQSRYGYAIGTRGTRSGVTLATYGGTKCAPSDHVEGVGQGSTLEPFSLYEDQLARRLDLVELSVTGLLEAPFPSNTVAPRLAIMVGRQPVPEASLTVSWRVISTNGPVMLSGADQSNPKVTFARRGPHLLQVVAGANGYLGTTTVEVVLAPPSTTGSLDLDPAADSYVRDGSFDGDNYGGEGSMALKKSSIGYNRRALLRFNLTGLPAFEQAVLVLRSSSPPEASTAPTLELRATSAAWQESSLRWTNQPVLGGALGAYLMSTNGLDEIDVTSPARAAWEGTGELGFALQVSAQPGDQVYYYATKESSAAAHSQLRLITSIVVPFADWITNYPGIPPAQRGPADDPDADGLLNSLEQAMVRNPGESDCHFLAVATRSSDTFQVIFTHARSLPLGVAYFFEQSPRPDGPWVLAENVTFTVNQEDLGLTRVTAWFRQQASSETYYRLSWTGF